MNNVCLGGLKNIVTLKSRHCTSPCASLLSIVTRRSFRSPATAAFNAQQFFARARSSGRCTAAPRKLTAASVYSALPRPSPTRGFHVGSTFHKSNPGRVRPTPSRRAANTGKRVPIPFGNIGKKELDTIFGHDMLYEEGNQILQILHSRRVTGALIDQGIFIKGTHTVPEEALRKALEWLREEYPVDEQYAADMWAAQEAAKLEETYIARAERLGLYKQIDSPEDISTKNVYGSDSVIDDFKRFHEQRREREAKERKESGEEQKQESMQLARRVEAERTQEIAAKAREERQQARALQGMVSHGETVVPELTLTNRLLPSTALGLGLIAVLILLGYTYAPPPKSFRIFPDTPTAVATIVTTIAPLVTIYLVWKIPYMWRFMNTYFVQTPSAPRAFGVLGNIVSHMGILHLATNIACIWFYGVDVHEDIGRGAWLAIYFSGGIFGSLCSLWSHVLTKRLTFYSFGASGSVWALMGAWAYLTFSKPLPSTENWDFAIRASQWTVIAFQILAHFTPGIMSRIDVASHVGGALVGLAGAAVIKWQAKRRRTALEDKRPDGAGKVVASP